MFTGIIEDARIHKPIGVFLPIWSHFGHERYFQFAPLPRPNQETSVHRHRNAGMAWTLGYHLRMDALMDEQTSVGVPQATDATVPEYCALAYSNSIP